LETWFHAEFKRAQGSVIELPHAREFLEFGLKQKMRMFLLSSVHEDHYRAQCLGNGFDLFFEHAYTGVWDKKEKIHELVETNGLVPGETLFIGDMAHDIATARHGGVHSCGVLTGYNTLPQLRKAGPDLIVEHLGELRDRLQSHQFEITAADKSGEEKRPPLSTVGALIFNHRDEMLLIRTHKWSNLWGIPGGKIKWGETSEAALRREIREETALKITDIQFVLVQDCIYSPEFYHDAHFVLLNYTCRCVAKSPKVVLNDEGREFRWLDQAGARKLPLNTPTKILLDAVFKPVPARPRPRASGPAARKPATTRV
jgi:ADP-ribose pyrophosphatase YjhB (NUDIX family)